MPGKITKNIKNRADNYDEPKDKSGVGMDNDKIKGYTVMNDVMLSYFVLLFQIFRPFLAKLQVLVTDLCGVTSDITTRKDFPQIFAITVYIDCLCSLFA